jgi:hypothetical protein
VTIGEAIRKFREAAIEKGDFAQAAGRDHQLHALMTAAVAEMRDHGSIGIDALRTLATDIEPHVRSWAATELLAGSDSTVRPVLEQLAMGMDPLAFAATEVLAQFDRGVLVSPFPRAR